MKWFASKRTRTESRFVIGPGKCTVCRRMRAIFSPEILQAWAVKGLMICAWILIHIHAYVRFCGYKRLYKLCIYFIKKIKIKDYVVFWV